MKRCFISIDIPEELYGEIRKIQDALPEFRGKKTEPENFHLTLKFLGEIDDEKIEEVRNKLRIIRFGKFETELKYAGFFGNQDYGVVWLHLANCGGLQRKVDKILSPEFKSEYRFMSHLTIARVESMGDRKHFMDKLGNIEIPEIGFIVNNFRLKESVLTREGPKYRTIEEYESN